MTTIDDQEYYDVYWLRIYFHLFRYLYMIFLIIMFSAVFSLTRFPPTFQFLLFLEKISTFLLWQESWNFWSHCTVQICSKQTLCIGRSVYWVGIVGNVLMVHLLMITLITIQLSIVTTVYNAVHSSVFVLHTSLETIDARICTYVLYYI